MNIFSNDTICAQATAQGGAISVVRVSGPRAIEITSSIFSKDLTNVKGYTLHYGNIVPFTDEQSSSTAKNEENVIDDVVVSVFRAPHSYTGENSTEISCHGSRYIVQKCQRDNRLGREDATHGR